MKTTKILLAALLVIVLAAALATVSAACSGSSGYDPQKCEQLKEKITSHEELTQDDYATMIDQVVYATKQLKTTLDDAKGNQEKEDALRKDSKFTDMMGYTLGFSIYLSTHRKELSPENIKKLDEAEQELKDYKLN